jgi:hypothetical protein
MGTDSRTTTPSNEVLRKDEENHLPQRWSAPRKTNLGLRLPTTANPVRAGDAKPRVTP